MGTPILCGLALAAGIASVGCWLAARAPRLIARVGPRLGPSGYASGRGAPRSAWTGPAGVFSRRLRDGARLAERWGPTADDLSARLRRAGSSLTVEQFRAEQVVWGAIGLGVGVAFGLGMSARGASPIALGAMVVATGVAGGVMRDYVLARATARREATILEELPTVADMLALSVSAGEGALGAIERVCRTSRGVLSEELRATLGEVRTGTPFAAAMYALAERTGVPALSRFATGVAIAVERGTPLADVLHSQALDVREAGRRRLIEQGGKKEIAMMVPVIFLILPVTVVFAVFPGIVAIRLGT